MAVDYKEELQSWANEDDYMKNVHIMELPHTNVGVKDALQGCHRNLISKLPDFSLTSP